MIALFDELPRATGAGKLFSVKTFILSCRTPYMMTREDRKLYINKEYSNAAGKLHLAFYAVLEQVGRVADETERMHAESRGARNKENCAPDDSRSGLASVKQWFSSLVKVPHSCSLVERSDASELTLDVPSAFEGLQQEALRYLRVVLKTLDQQVRNFEQTFIATMRSLFERVAQTNLALGTEESMRAEAILNKKARIIDN